MALQLQQDEVPRISTKHPALDDFCAQLQRDAAAKKQKTVEREKQREDARKCRNLRGDKEDAQKMPQEVLDLIVAWAMPKAIIVAIRHDTNIQPTIVNWDYFKLTLQLMRVSRGTMEDGLKHVAKNIVLRIDVTKSLSQPRYEHDERAFLPAHVQSLGRAHQTSKASFSLLKHITTLQVQDMRLLDLNYTDDQKIWEDKAPKGSSDFHNRYLLRYTNSYATPQTNGGTFKHISFKVEKFSLSMEPQPAHPNALPIMHLVAGAFGVPRKLSALTIATLRAHAVVRANNTANFHWYLRNPMRGAIGHEYDDITAYALRASAVPAVWDQSKVESLPGVSNFCVVLWGLRKTAALYEKYKETGEWEIYEPEVTEEVESSGEDEAQDN
ncbi:hypothetical protein CLAFUW4_10563 [Fulvia fulva]|nr:hypothetical protein CLAFUR4_10568 [Fulvia fulva]WPV19245.1 hypothetical protein CLAFUW4_10563 [Fulvia fulva]WPV33983.1 hypothetical protein CLAFUW7_10565 [Fulvia fulva]